MVATDISALTSKDERLQDERDPLPPVPEGKMCLLDHPVRSRMFLLVLEDPGINFTAMMRVLGLANGVVSFHTRKMVKGGLLTTRHIDGKRMYFPKDMGFAIPTELDDRIMEAVLRTPGISQNGIARAVGKSRQLINYHIKGMVRRGVIRTVRRGSRTDCYVCNWVH